MELKTATRTMTALLAVPLLFVGHGEANAMVLCVGDDGHIEIEANSDGSCTSDTDSHRVGSFGNQEFCDSQHDGGHCGTCLDIPITFLGTDACHPIIRIAQTDFKVSLPNTVLAQSAAAFPSSYRAQNRSIRALRTHNSLLVDMRTTGFGSGLLLI